MGLLLGKTSAGTNADFFGSGNSAAWKFTAGASGNLKYLRVLLGVANPGLTAARIAIYTDAGTLPGTPLGIANVDDIAQARQAGEFQGTLASTVAIVAGTSYRLAVYGAGEQVDLVGDVGAGNEGVGNMPNPWNNLGAMADTPVIYGLDQTATPDTLFVWSPNNGGAQPASPASAWTAGSYVELLPAGWPFDIALGDLEFEGPAAPTLATTFEVLFEIATGAAGSETVIAQIPWTFRNVTAVGYLRGDPINLIGLPEPITIAANTRVAVRVSDSHTAALTYTGVKAMFRELAAAGGAALTQTVNDTVSLADSAATAAAWDRNAADTLTLADATALLAAYQRQVDDAATLADLTVQQTGKQQALGDTLTVADALTSVAGFAATVTDAVTVADSLAAVSAYARLIADAATLADTTTPARAISFQQDDALALADALASTATWVRVIADTAGLADTPLLAVAYARAIAEAALTLTDDAATSLFQGNIYTQPIADTLTLSDTPVAVIGYARSLTDALTLADLATALVGYQRQINDTATVDDALARTVTYAVTVPDVVTLADDIAVAASYQRTLTDLLALADLLTPRTVGHILIIGPSPTGLLMRNAAGNVAGAQDGSIIAPAAPRTATTTPGRLA